MLTAATFVVVALLASGGRMDASVLIWSALGIFGVVFGLTTVGNARRRGAPEPVRPEPAPVQTVAASAAAAHAAEPLLDTFADSVLSPGAAAFVERPAPRAPKHAAELAL